MFYGLEMFKEMLNITIVVTQVDSCGTRNEHHYGSLVDDIMVMANTECQGDIC